MKAPIAIVLVGCCLFGGIMALAAEDESTPKPSELDTLRKQVQALEARIEVLEKLLAEQRQAPNALTLPPSLHGRPVPETWSRREFNGMPYYVIPLGQDGNQTAPKKQAVIVWRKH